MKKIGIIFCLFVLSCSKDNVVTENSNVILGKIINIESLKSLPLGQNDTIVVTFTGGQNGCSEPDHLEVTLTGFLISFKAYYNIPLAQASPPCTTIVPVLTLKYIFKPTSKGTYIYKSFDTNINSTTVVN